MRHVPLFTFRVTSVNFTGAHFVAAKDKMIAERFVREMVGLSSFVIEPVSDDGHLRITDCVLDDETK